MVQPQSGQHHRRHLPPRQHTSTTPPPTSRVQRPNRHLHLRPHHPAPTFISAMGSSRMLLLNSGRSRRSPSCCREWLVAYRVAMPCLVCQWPQQYVLSIQSRGLCAAHEGALTSPSSMSAPTHPTTTADDTTTPATAYSPQPARQQTAAGPALAPARLWNHDDLLRPLGVAPAVPAEVALQAAGRASAV